MPFLLIPNAFSLYLIPPSETFGLHSDDGKVFTGGTSRDLTRPFGEGDTIGVGLDIPTRCVFYTRNGEFLGILFFL